MKKNCYAVKYVWVYTLDASFQAVFANLARFKNWFPRTWKIMEKNGLRRDDNQNQYYTAEFGGKSWLIVRHRVY